MFNGIRYIIKSYSLREICRRHYPLIAIESNPLWKRVSSGFPGRAGAGLLRRSFLLICIFQFAFFNSAKAQTVGYTDHFGRVIDATTNKPLPNATVTHSIEGKTDEKGRFTIRYYDDDSNQSVIISHPGFHTDTFNYAPTFVSLRRLTAESQKNRLKVGVVLSGGGAKGVAHISALRAIEKAGFPIDYIAGTSMGSLIGGLYAVGWSVDELDSLVRHQDWSFLLTDRPKPENLDMDTRKLMTTYPLWYAFSRRHHNESAGFIRGVNLDRLFNQLLAGYLDSISFDSLPIPFACVATDVVSNTEIDFRSGYLKQAMRASMAIPGVFSPVRIGNQVLVDGGVLNNYPADLARQMGADIIIGVSVQDDTLSADEFGSALDIILQVMDAKGKDKFVKNVKLSDLMMKVDVNGYSAASFTESSIDTLLRRGAEEAERHWDELLALRRKYNIDSVPVPERHHRVVRPKIHASTTSPLSHSPIVGVTFRFDNEETGALQVGTLLPYRLWKLPMEFYGHLRLGDRIQLLAENSFFPHGITSPSVSYSFRKDNLDIYVQGVRTYNVKYYRHTFEAVPINSTFRRYKLRAGVKFDYYDFYSPVLSAATTSIYLDDHHLLSYFFQSDINTENHPYLSTSGVHMRNTIIYHTDNFLGYDGGHGIAEITAQWSIALSPTPRLTFKPSLYGRLLLHSGEIPLTLSNALGSQQQLVEQQFFFPGVHSLTYIERCFLSAQLRMQFAIARNHYLLLDAGMARHTLNFNQLVEDLPNIWGVSLGYCYYTFLGPVEASLGYSSLAPGMNFYLNLGHRF